MKKLLLSVIAICGLFLFAQNTQAQNGKSDDFKAYLDEVYKAYETLDPNAIVKYYAADAQEIGPDGSFVTGIATLKASWEGILKVLDKKPSFTHKFVSARQIRPDVAIITFEQEADLVMGGQQIGGKTICMAVISKKEGRWQIEYDSMTPVIPMPGLETAGNK